MPDNMWQAYVPVHTADLVGECHNISTAETLIAEARAGRMFVLTDDEDRENEGDLVIPAQFAGPEIINFMIKHCRGLVCLTLTPRRVRELGLPMMASHNSSSFGTNFTVSIEAREGITTGISPYDRARTIATAINAESKAADLATPGHMFPLEAKQNGVLERPGHTEASVDIARLAGLIPAAVICEILNEDGTMARGQDLIRFCDTHGLKMGTIADLIAYRERTESLLHKSAETEIAHEIGGRWGLHVFTEDVSGREHLVLTKGWIATCSMASVYVHNVSPLEGLLPGRAGGGVAASMRAISDAGRGVLILVRDGAANSLSNHIAGIARSGASRAISQPALVRQILGGLGFPLRAIT